MVCAWVKVQCPEKIRMNSSVTITIAYTNVFWVCQLSFNGWMIASIEVIQEDPRKLFHNRITSNWCNNLQEWLRNDVICHWDKGTSDILLTLLEDALWLTAILGQGRLSLLIFNFFAACVDLLKYYTMARAIFIALATAGTSGAAAVSLVHLF